MLIAAVDIGTSSTRALLFDDARFIGVSHQIEVALKADESGAAELDCAEVMNAVVQCVRTISGACPAGPRIEAVTLSSHASAEYRSDRLPPGCAWPTKG